MADASLAGSGIYCIRNTVNGKLYVGSAVNLSFRWNLHRTNLRAHEHHSRKLQRAWDKYGPDSFEFSVLEKVDKTEALIEREQFWIDELKAVSTGYNICPIAGSALGRALTQEHRGKLSAKAKNRTAEQRAKYAAAQTGKTYSLESRAKMSASALGRVPWNKGLHHGKILR